MSVHYKVKAAPKKKRVRPNGNTKPRASIPDLNGPARLRVGHLLTILGISAPPFYKRLKDGKIPPADGNDPRPWWSTETVRKHLAGGAK